MSLSRALFVALVVTSFVGGWLVMANSREPGARPELIPRIVSLSAPAPFELQGPETQIEDSFVSPGGPVWILLKQSEGRRRLLCRFDRAPKGGVQDGECRRVVRRSVAQVGLALGGSNPVGVGSDGKATELLSGRERSVAREAGMLRAQAEPGTRLIRGFSLMGAGQIRQASPAEGHYVGPFGAYANAKAPLVSGIDRRGRPTFQCTTPSGYILASWPGASGGSASDRGAERGEATVSFFAAAKTVAERTASITLARSFDADLACRGATALLTWVDAGSRSLGRLSCTPNGCSPEQVKLPGVDTENMVAMAELAARTVLLWHTSSGELRVRIGEFSSLPRSPTAPLWQSDEPPMLLHGEGKSTTLPLGDSLLVFARAPDLAIAQIHSDARIEWLKLTLTP